MSRSRPHSSPSKRQKTEELHSEEDYVAMARHCETFTPSDFDRLVENQALAAAVFTALTPNEQIKLLTFTTNPKKSPSLLEISLQSTSLAPGFFEWVLTQLPSALRKTLIVKANMTVMKNYAFHQKLKVIFSRLPYARRYAALKLLTAGTDQPGLHALVKYPHQFAYFLKQIPGGLQSEALLQQNAEGQALILAALDYPDNIESLFKKINRENLIKVLATQTATAAPLFSVMLYRYPHIKMVLSELLPVELVSLLSIRHPVSGHSILNEFTINAQNELDANNIETIDAMLSRLAYRERLQVMRQPDGRGDTFSSIVENNQCDLLNNLLSLCISPVKEIQQILLNYILKEVLFGTEGIQLHSHEKMKNALYYVELQQEMAYFRPFLDDSVNQDAFLEVFRKVFHERCDYRSLGGDHDVIPFYYMPESPTNLMLFELMHVLYCVESLADVIPILMPRYHQSIAGRQMMFDMPEQFPEGMKTQDRLTFFRSQAPAIRLSENYPGLKTVAPTLAALSACVFTDKFVVDLNDINQYGFKAHAHLIDQLESQWPGYACHIYSHNQAWQRLASDVSAMKKMGATPKEAIECLISGLFRGGERVTAAEDNAGDVSLVAVANFVSYFEALPSETQQALKQLPDENGHLTLTNFFNEILKYQCVEVLSETLVGFVKFNASHPLLNSVPGVSPQHVKDLERQCRLGLDTAKSNDIVLCEPDRLVAHVVKASNLSKLHHNLIDLIFIPNEFMTNIWRHLTLEHEASVFHQLADSFTYTIFTATKMLAITRAIAINQNKWPFALTEPFFCHILQYCIQQENEFTRAFFAGIDSELLSFLLGFRHAQQCLMPVLLSSSAEKTMLVLERLTSEALKSVLLVSYGEGRLLHDLPRVSMTLFERVMGLLSPDDRFHVLQCQDAKGQSFFESMQSKLSMVEMNHFQESLERLGYPGFPPPPLFDDQGVRSLGL